MCWFEYKLASFEVKYSNETLSNIFYVNLNLGNGFNFSRNSLVNCSQCLEFLRNVLSDDKK